MSARAAALLLLLGGAAAAQEVDPVRAEFEAITGGVGERTKAASAEAMRAFVAAHPASPDAPRGLVWLAGLEIELAHPPAARAALEQAVRAYPGSEWADQALGVLAELDVEAGDFAAALARYERLAARPSPLAHFLGVRGLEDAKAARLRHWLVLAAAAAMTMLALARLLLAFRAGRAPWRPPREVLLAGPLLLLALALGARLVPEERHALQVVDLGGLALLWAQGAWLEGRRLSVAARTREALLALGLAAGLGYCALVSSGLWQKFLETVAVGPEA